MEGRIGDGIDHTHTHKKKRRGSENLRIQIQPRNVEENRKIGDDRSPNDGLEDNAEKKNQPRKKKARR
jgi:hypothetical protein